MPLPYNIFISFIFKNIAITISGLSQKQEGKNVPKDDDNFHKIGQYSQKEVQKQSFEVIRKLIRSFS